MNCQQIAIGMAYSTALAVAGHRVTYGRGDTTVSAVAIPGKTSNLVDTEFGALAKDTRDFIFKRACLVWTSGDLEGTAIVPQVGDYIIDGATQYEVVQPPGQDCYHLPDPDKAFIRIHTQE